MSDCIEAPRDDHQLHGDHELHGELDRLWALAREDVSVELRVSKILHHLKRLRDREPYGERRQAFNVACQRLDGIKVRLMAKRG